MAPYRDPDNQNQHRGSFKFAPPPQPQWAQVYTQPIPQPTRTSGPAAVFPAMGQSAPKAPYTPLQTTEAQRRAAAGGGGGGGAGGAGYFAGGPVGDGHPINSTPSLAQDPAYQAFMAALGLEKSHLQQSADDQINVINRELARRLPDIETAGLYAREGIANNFESRGMYRSGLHNQMQGRQRADQGQQISALQGSVADQVFLIRQELARRLQEAEQRGAGQALQSGAGLITG